MAYILSSIVVFTTIDVIACYYDHIYWVTTTYYPDIHYILFISLLLHYISRLAITDYLLFCHYRLSFGLYYLGSLHHTIEEHKALTERSGGRVDTERSGVSSRVGYADLISTCGMTGAERRE